MKTALVQYTGKSQMFVDSLRRGSGRVWHGPGSVLEVPAGETFIYLAHSTLFRVVTQEQVDGELEGSRGALEKARGQLASLTDAHLRDLHKAVQNEVELRAKRTVNFVSPPVAPVKQPTAAEVTASGDVAAIQAYNARIQSVVTAIRGMDLKDDSIAHNGRPTAEGVRDHMGGQLPSEDEITMAMQLIDGVIAEPAEDVVADVEPKVKPMTKKAKAKSALAELDSADRATMVDMANTFDMEFHNRLGDDKLREKLREHLEAV